jgi:hypothetical protein
MARTLTTHQGHPVHSNQQQRTICDCGLATLENYQFLQKISHLERERIAERVVHARAFVAASEFRAFAAIGDEPAGKYSRAEQFEFNGSKTRRRAPGRACAERVGCNPASARKGPAVVSRVGAGSADMGKQRRYRVGISGSYGGLNLGDEAILKAMITELHRSVPVDVTVFSRNPEDTLARHDVQHVVPVRDVSRREVEAEINGLDLFILWWRCHFI